jgi:mannosylfructose-phosphate synthase
MITNHGIHQWKIVPGLPDTGGQNVFVNQFTESLAQQGYKITIVNRGGYQHPISDEPRTGLHYKDQHQRLIYLEDDVQAFVRKEDMDARLPALASTLINHFSEEEEKFDLMISHYWDGAKLGLLYNQSLESPVTHIWVPHSLGILKKRNVSPEKWASLRIDERIANEKKILSEVDSVASTSAIIEQSLKEDYQYQAKTLFLPPCVDSARYFPHHIGEDHPIWSFLSQQCGLSAGELRSALIITEISRTDQTKRKDVVIKAFARVREKHPEAILAITIDQKEGDLSKSLMDLIKELDIKKYVAVLGSVWDELPDIYALTDIYCTPSVMEGFGMTSQEAAATGIPVIASDLVPFVTEYLLGNRVEEVLPEGFEQPIKLGEGAIVVKADDIEGFVYALDMLLSKPELRMLLGKRAYQMTIPYFTWENVVRQFLHDVEMIVSEKADG